MTKVPLFGTNNEDLLYHLQFTINYPQPPPFIMGTFCPPHRRRGQQQTHTLLLWWIICKNI